MRAFTASLRFGATATIGHPPRFFTTLEQCGITPVKTVALADHQAITERDMLTIATAEQVVLMTEKDAVKCRSFAEGHKNGHGTPVINERITGAAKINAPARVIP